VPADCERFDEGCGRMVSVVGLVGEGGRVGRLTCDFETDVVRYLVDGCFWRDDMFRETSTPT